MSRQSTISTHHDSAGEYEVELFDCPDPKRVIVCSHGNGVRRWDGERFFYEVAEHYADAAVLLVDQNQPDGEGVVINPLPILASRVDEIIAEAKRRYPGVPIVLIGHSMGCSVATRVQVQDLAAIVFVAAADGRPDQKLIDRYGPEIVHGKTVVTSDGLKKGITAAYFESVKGLVWEDEYRKLLERFSPVYAFESGGDEILGTEHLNHHTMPFAKYEVIEGAKHNLAGQYLNDFFAKLDPLLANL